MGARPVTRKGLKNMVKIITLDRVPNANLAPHPVRYKDFSPGLPASGVKLAGMERETPEEAAQEGLTAVRAYEARDPFGNMGVVCGVMKTALGYRAVICTYHSNT